MKVQIISKITKEFNKETEKWEEIQERINNVQYIEFDPLNDNYAITEDKELRRLFLNKECFRLSLNSFEECRKRRLVA